MSLILQNKQFTDIFGNVTTYYRSNAGDKVTALFTIDTSIRFKSSEENTLTVYFQPNEIKRLSGNWIDDGWRVGDTFTIQIFYGNGTSWFGYPITSTVEYLSGTTMGCTNIIPSGSLIPNGRSYGNDEYMVLTNHRQHDGLDVLINHSQNGLGGATASLIDGEDSRIRFEGLNAMTVSDVLTGIQTGYKSGQFALNSTLTYDSVNSAGVRRYLLEIELYNSGAYDEQWFLGANCLKLYAKFKFQSIIGEPFGSQDIIYSEDGDTGYFNQGFNTGIPQAQVLQGISAIDWANATTGSFTIDTNVGVTDFYIGGLYISLDETYYKNKLQSQTEITMQLDSHVPITSPLLYLSFVNEFGAGWNLALSPATVVGTQRTYNYSIIPNAQFQSFFDDREEGDRRFVIYFRAGNVNLTLFDGQLTKEAPIAGPITDINFSNFIKHNDNTTDVFSYVSPASSRHFTEDDVAYILKWKLQKNVIHSALRVGVEMRNLVTNEYFILQQSNFDLSNAQVSSDGRQLFNLSVGQVNNLPNTSAKKMATFELYPNIDETSKYGVKLYYPYLNDWRYWVSLQGVNADFFGNQNRDWRHYLDNPDWTVRAFVEIDNINGAYVHYESFAINDYDTGNATSVIELYRPNGMFVTALVDDEVMTIKAIHTTATALNPTSIWGMITIEPFEGSPRWITSNVVPSDGNINNPLGDMTVTVVGNVTTFECTLDMNKIDSTTGFSIGSRIYGDDVYPVVDRWLTTDGDLWEQTDGGNWLIDT